MRESGRTERNKKLNEKFIVENMQSEKIKQIKKTGEER